MNHLSAAEFFDGRHLEAAQAIKSGNMEHLRLAARGLDIDKPGKKEMTLLWFAIMNKNFEATRVLVRLGSNPDEQVAEGLGVPVEYALRNKDLRFLTAMLDGGLSVNYAEPTAHRSLLHNAAGAFGATIDHVKLLVTRGADFDLPDLLGETPLMSAIFTMQPDRALYLVERGAKLQVYTVRGVTPAWAVQSAIDDQQPGSPMRSDFEHLRERMNAHGAKFPPDPPEKVRAWMKTQGMEVAE
jgi:ankyrin repeat protein